VLKRTSRRQLGRGAEPAVFCLLALVAFARAVATPAAHGDAVALPVPTHAPAHPALAAPGTAGAETRVLRAHALIVSAVRSAAYQSNGRCPFGRWVAELVG
jgi:hypothetical protein